MSRLSTLLFLALLTCFQIAQADVTITFNVNMNHTIVNGSGVYVAGGNIGNPGDNELIDPDEDGIYTGSITVPDNFFSPYIILNGNCGDYSCKERIIGQACSSGPFDDRSFQAGTEDMTINTCFGVCSETTDCSLVDVTFNLNMTTQDVAESGVFLAGGAAFGQPGDIELTDPDEDDVYSVTLSLPADFRDYYTFTNGNCPGDFNCKEQIGGQICANAGHFNDREIIVGDSDQTISTCFGFCSEDGSCPETYSVTFQVDMNNEGPNPEGVNMGSDIDGWSGDISMSDPDEDGIYSVTFDLAPGFYQYKFINGPGWDFGTIEFAPLDCDVTGGTNGNRGVSVLNQDIVLPPVCFGTCSEGCPTLIDVTFRVNMALEDVHPDGVNMGSNIDSWSGNIELFQVGDSDIWEVTIPLPSGSYEYKFINGPGWCCGPAENAPEECDVAFNIPGGPFGNRGVTVDAEASDIILPPVCFNSCDICPIVGCMDPNAHNFRPRAEAQKGIDFKTFYWDDVSFINEAGASSPYCGTQVTHFAGDAGSEVLLTINTVDANTMEVIIESPDETNPVDVLVIPGGSGAAISPDDLSVPGQIKKTLTWDNPPAEVFLNVLWSKESFPGNWQLNTNDFGIPFGVNCTLGDEETTIDVLQDFEAGAGLVDFNGTTSEIVADPTDAENTVVETSKVAPAELFAGTFTDLDAPIPFTVANKKVSVRVWSPEAGITVLLKVENSANGGINSEVSTTTTVAMGWETLEFNFNNGNNPINTNETYDRVVIFFDFGTPYTGSDCETCDDGIQNGSEKGVDCGGTNPNCVPCNEGCTDPNSHNYDAEVMVDNGSCETCNDGVLNGDETDIDCGGTLCAPCNDLCHDRQVVFCGDTLIGDTSNATDTNPGLDCGDVDGPAEGVWFLFQGTGDDITLSTDHLGTDGTDTNLQVFTGTCGNLTCVAGDEDSGETFSIGWTSVLTFESNPGTYYYIYLSGYEGDVGPYEMTIDCYDPVEIVVTGIAGVPASGVGTGSIGVNVTGGDTSCGPLTFSWVGPEAFAASTEDISGLTTIGEYTLTVTDCAGVETSRTILLPNRSRNRRGRRGSKAAFVEEAIFKAYPNPFSQHTLISFNLATEEQVSLNIYDITGKQVADLFNGHANAETDYQFQFGNDLPTGSYIAALTTASGETKHIKLVVTH